MLRRTAHAQTRTLFVNTWGGSWTAAEEAAYFKPFTEATGIRIRTVAPVSYAKLKAQVAAKSYEWDMTSIEQGELRRRDAPVTGRRGRSSSLTMRPTSSRRAGT